MNQELLNSTLSLSRDQKARALAPVPESAAHPQSKDKEPNASYSNYQQEFPISGNVRAKQCARFLSIGISTWWLWVKQGRVKEPIRHGARVSVWQAEYVRSLAENGVKEVA